MWGRFQKKVQKHAGMDGARHDVAIYV